MSDDLTCPIDDCPETWPDTQGHDGGRQRRFIHMYDAHDDVRGLPFKKLL